MQTVILMTLKCSNDDYSDDGYCLLSPFSVLPAVLGALYTLSWFHSLQETHFQELCLLNYKMGMIFIEHY